MSSAVVLVGSGCGVTNKGNTAKHPSGQAVERVSENTSPESKESKPKFSCPVSAARASEILGRELSLTKEESNKKDFLTVDYCQLLGKSTGGGAPVVSITLWGHPKPEALLEQDKAEYDNVVERPDLGEGAYLDIDTPEVAEVTMLDPRGGGVWQIMVSYGADQSAHKPAPQALEEIIQLLPK
jgi:hypothetical protein